MWWLGPLSGVSMSTASHKGEELSLPSQPRFPLTRQRWGLASKSCLFPLCTDEAELISGGTPWGGSLILTLWGKQNTDLCSKLT